MEVLAQNFLPYRFLSETQKAKLHDELRLFVAAKNWEGCGGLTLDDGIRVTIAAHACLLALGMDGDPFASVRTILVYPSAYVAPTVEPLGSGVVLETEIEHEGEAHRRGPVILSWQDVLADCRNPQKGKNLVFHEFAHQLDMLDGAADGVPPLASREQARRWRKVMAAEYRRLVAASQQGRATLLDQYGATNEAEFFAVATECFFNLPIALSRQHPRLYESLRDYYRQDPARWCERASRLTGN
jgi:Mlc titration factor MtfA (ptsG expression regulator)